VEVGDLCVVVLSGDEDGGSVLVTGTWDVGIRVFCVCFLFLLWCAAMCCKLVLLA
jgi:hypothetical protein